MKWMANRIMDHRARRLFHRVSPHLPHAGTIGDIGSGTGHNAQQIRERTSLHVREYDVDDLHWVGPGPSLMSADSIPVQNHSFQSVLLLFVLQYPESVSRVLREARRVTQGPVIVVQSTYAGRLGRFVLRIREFLWGRFAFHVAASLKLVRPIHCPLHPRRCFTHRELLDEFHRAGFIVRCFQRSNWPVVNVSRDLFVLESIKP